MASARSKLLIYPTVLIDISAAAAAATSTRISLRKGNDYNYFINIKYRVLKNKEEKEDEEENVQLEAFRKQELRKVYKAVFKPEYYTEDGTPVYPVANGRTVYQMVRDYEEEEENNNNNNKKYCPPFEQCAGTMQILTEEEDEDVDVLRLEFEATLRGMSIPEFLVYAKQEKEYCKEMCAKCKKVPLPPGCEQEIVDKYCGR